MKVIRMGMIIVGWVVASYALIFVIAGLDFHWNFFNWSPKWDGEAARDGIGILAVLVCIFFLARATRDRISQVISALICLLLAVFAVADVFPAEPVTGGFLGRTMSSPLWYRSSCSFLLFFPGIFWLWSVLHRPHKGVSPA